MGEVVQPGFRAFVARIGGDAGREWLASVPRLLEDAAALWKLDLGLELPGGLLACVVAATTEDGRDAVLKLPSPWARGPDEVEALRAWAGGGAPELLSHDPETGAILLERIRPGEHPADVEVAALARLLGLLHVPAWADAPLLDEVVASRIGNAETEGRASPERVAWSRTALGRLAVAAAPAVLVHGDFDERNLLVCARRVLCAIDPLPCAGDPLYDAAYWIHGNRRAGRRARFDALSAELCLSADEQARLRDWCGIVAVHG